MIVVEQSSRFACADNSAAFENIGTLGQGQDGVHVLFDDQQAHAVMVQL